MLLWNVWRLAVLPVKRDVAALLTFVACMGFATYACEAAGLAAVARSRAGGYVLPLRFAHWLTCTPCLVAVLGKLVPPGALSRQARRQTRVTAACDVAMLLLAAAEHALPRPWQRRAALGGSVALFVPTLAGQLWLMRAAATPDDVNGRPLRQLRRTTVVTWLLYPFSRLLVVCSGLGSSGEEVALTVLDLLSKSGYASLLLVASFDHLHAAKVSQTNARRATPIRR